MDDRGGAGIGLSVAPCALQFLRNKTSPMCVNVAAGDMGVWKWVTNLALALQLITFIFIFIASPALVCAAETNNAYTWDQNDRKYCCPSPSTPDGTWLTAICRCFHSILEGCVRTSSFYSCFKNKSKKQGPW